MGEGGECGKFFKVWEGMGEGGECGREWERVESSGMKLKYWVLIILYFVM